jgi:opacity protein-like surface antigen
MKILARHVIGTVSLWMITTSALCLNLPWPVPGSSDDNAFASSSHWFVGGYLGVQRPDVNTLYTINNGSGYPPPNNVDSYSTNFNNTAAAAVEGGYRWARAADWIPAYALSLRYQHSFATDVGNQIEQFSLSSFNNYTYKWDISSDIFLVMGKLNLFEWRHMLPFVTGGAGVALNNASNYHETAVSGVTARTSPGFATRSSGEFAWDLGLGVDWKLYPQLIMTLDYEHQHLGTVQSGYGAGSWSGQRLRSGTYNNNGVMFGMVYLLS